jgi:sulfatase modifying factor 1
VAANQAVITSAKPTEVIADLCHLVRIHGGTFLMGDDDGYSQERPAHEVYVDAFWAGKYCVSVREYLDFIRSPDSNFQELWCDFINPCFILKGVSDYEIWEGAEDFPIIQVSFVGAVAYCNWLSRKFDLAQVYDLESLEADLSQNGFRLLKEAEWEYACGGPKQYKYGYGDNFRSDLCSYKQYAGEFKQRRASQLHIGGFGLYDYSPLPVGTLPPNDYGLHEMIGNVNEWCHDRYGPYDNQVQLNPHGKPTGSFRVIRGGSFIDDVDKLRKTYRHGIHYLSKCTIDGFRVARNGSDHESNIQPT